MHIRIYDSTCNGEMAMDRLWSFCRWETQSKCVLFVALQGFQGKTGPPGPGGVVGPQVH